MEVNCWLGTNDVNFEHCWSQWGLAKFIQFDRSRTHDLLGTYLAFAKYEGFLFLHVDIEPESIWVLRAFLGFKILLWVNEICLIFQNFLHHLKDIINAVKRAKFCLYVFNDVVFTCKYSKCLILQTLGKSPRGREFETHQINTTFMCIR